MDKLNITNNGGHPFTMDDLDFLQSALSEGIKGAVSPWFDGDTVILQGIVGTVGVTHTTYTNGYILLNNEVYPVIGGVFLNGSYVIIDVAVTYNPIGNKLYENGTTVNCYEKRIGVMKISTGSGTEIDLADCISFKQSLMSGQYKFVFQDEPAWQALPLNSGWSNGTPAPRYRINKIGEVELDGVVLNPATTVSNNTICNLPIGFRPNFQKAFTIFGSVDTVTTAVCVIIFTNGNVRIFGTIGNDYGIYLNQIRFSKT